jgi:2-polyprenyl-3-methyl-5-hydroxy-6-metoxy-1,4-benzoquinol methylase
MMCTRKKLREGPKGFRVILARVHACQPQGWFFKRYVQKNPEESVLMIVSAVEGATEIFRLSVLPQGTRDINNYISDVGGLI